MKRFSHGTAVPDVLLAGMDADLKRVKKEIWGGQDVNASVSMCPVLFACATGNYKLAKVLLDAGANVQLGMISLLVEAISSPADEDTKCKFVELLLSKGADVNRAGQVRSRHRLTPLQTAIDAGCLKVAKLLVQRGARIVDPESNKPIFYIDCRLDLSASMGNIAMFEWLLEIGPKVTGSRDDWVSPALFGVIYSAKAVDVKRRMLEQLVAKGADLNAKDEPEGCITLLHAACGRASASGAFAFHNQVVSVDLGIVRFLLSNGADVNAIADDGRTALLVLCETDVTDLDEIHVEDAHRLVLNCVRALLKHGADVDLCDNDGRSPIEVAVQTGKCAVVEMLLVHKKAKLPKYF